MASMPRATWARLRNQHMEEELHSNKTSSFSELSENRILQDCVDSPLGWYDADGPTFNCDWYASASYYCSDFDHKFERLGKTANQACCACGGGERRDSVGESSCQDDPVGWHDIDGATYDCEWYKVGNRCSLYGDSFENMDKTANKACCSCDGGRQVGGPVEITYELVKNALERMNYAFFVGKYNVNLVGIRGPSRKAGSWDDTFCLLYQDDEGANKIKVFEEFTTDPGVYYLKNPMKANGCAILKPGQYRSAYTIGMHGDPPQYEAVVQRAGPVSVYRDNNKDDMLDMDETTVETGYFGINIHHGHDSETIGDNSAGCEVFKWKSDLTTVLDICKKQQPNGYGSRFTYTLIDQSDL